jgi:hypothetical protein
MGEIETLLIKVEANQRQFDAALKGLRVHPALTRQPISGKPVTTGDETFFPTIGYRWRFSFKTYFRNLWRALLGG